MFELTTWNASFPEFFIILRRYTFIENQLLIPNDRNRVRWEVLGLSQDGACTDSNGNFSVNSLKGDLSNTTTFNPPFFMGITMKGKLANAKLRELKHVLNYP